MLQIAVVMALRAALPTQLVAAGDPDLRRRWPPSRSSCAPYLLAFSIDPPKTPQLRQDVQTLERREGVSGTPVDVEKVSNVTTEANAFAVGLGPTTRVVIWDTLLDGRFTNGEVRFVLAHEFGHVARGHLWKGIGWLALFGFPLAFALARITRRRGGLGDPGVLPYGFLVLAAAPGRAHARPERRLTAHTRPRRTGWRCRRPATRPRRAASSRSSPKRASRSRTRRRGTTSSSRRTRRLMQRIAMTEAWKEREP